MDSTHWSAGVVQCFGSGSGPNSIKSMDPDPDPDSEGKIEKSFKSSCFEVLDFFFSFEG
jgi:hypothetical protein